MPAFCSRRTKNVKTRVRTILILVLLPVTVSYVRPIRAETPTGRQKLRFNRDIRPLLSDRCFACHGPDKAGRKADLRLDRREEAVKAGVIDPANLTESEILARITSDDPDEVMPPPAMKKPLTAKEREILREWVAQGAEYEPHWAFVPVPKEITVPTVQASDAVVKNPIDRFVLDRLSKERLRQSPQADRVTWLRRVSFDLTGLPPTLEEIDAFVADARPDDIAKNAVLDTLFATDAYAERMAMDWLDVARYADTFGYQADRDMHTWPWRDWLIEAFRKNLPYDKFVTWQIAGDLLPNATKEQILATAFNRLHRQTNEGGSIEEEFRVEYVSDRVRTAGTAFLGLSMECSRCHDHKYDPISQKDFYGLSAFFGNIDEHGLYSHFTETAPTPALPLYKGEQKARHEVLKNQIQELQGKIDAWLKSPEPASINVSKSPERPKADWSANFDDLKATGDYGPAMGREGSGQSIRFGGDDAFVCKDVAPFRRAEPFTVSLWLKPAANKPRMVIWHTSRAAEDSAYRGASLILDDGIPVVSLIHFWPGDAISIRAKQPISIDRWTQVTVSYDGSSRAEGLRLYVDGAESEVDIVRDRLTRDIIHNGAWGDSDAGSVKLTLGARFRDVGFQGGQIDDVEVFRRELSPLEVAHAAGTKLEATRTDIARHLLLHEPDPEIRKVRDDLDKLRKEENDLISGVPQVMVMKEWQGPRKPSYVLHRGEYASRGEAVGPSTPESILPFEETWPRNRVGLAQWMTDERNPLVSRVIANRLWMLCFGRGLVATLEDFGFQGEEPSHPELLDWLARDLMDHGWDLRRTLRTILTSATYGQSSTPRDPVVFESDPDNRLLARGPRYRLSAEMIRDNALAVSGLLVRKVGGPSVKPYQPAGLWEESGTGKSYVQDHGESLYRRSMYTFWRRTAPPPGMTTFDAPSREFCMVKRERTATPLQALATLNDVQYVEAARVLAERLTKESPGDVTAQIRKAYRLCTGQTPDEARTKLLAELYEEQKAHFAAIPAEAGKLISTGEFARDKSLNPVEHAALTVVVQALFNFDPFVTKR